MLNDVLIKKLFFYLSDLAESARNFLWMKLCDLHEFFIILTRKCSLQYIILYHIDDCLALRTGLIELELI